MNPQPAINFPQARRQFLGRSALGLGTAALSMLLERDGYAAPRADPPHTPPRAKRVIYLFMSGAPSQLDLFDYKPKLAEMFDQELPDSVRRGQRLTGMSLPGALRTSRRSVPLKRSLYPFSHGEPG